MLFRALFFAAVLTAAAPITAQVVEDISMLTAPGSTESEKPALVLPLLVSLDPQSLVLVTWKDKTTSTVTVNQVLSWYDEP
ncbi:hypothetical protein [Neolewinella persica]|uniref:hypothetical protein n=1 Tax=Neolewinella persica TaxID=70998 RepID=UPI0003752968|nr:hypothetical protein [Neolewinella persica]